MKLNLINELDKLEWLIFTNEHSFLHQFEKNSKANDIVNVAFSTSGVHYTFCHYSGQHIANSIKWEAFEKWVGTLPK